MFRCRQALAVMQAKGRVGVFSPPHPRPLSPVGGEGLILCFCVLEKRAVAPLSPVGGEGGILCFCVLEKTAAAPLSPVGGERRIGCQFSVFSCRGGGRILVAARPAHQVPTRGLTIDSIWSCSRPFDARIVLFRNGSGFPLQSVTRPPASVTSNCPAAKSHGDN